MRLRKLRGFDDFRCAADQCPDTCCRDWEVALDDEAVRRYRALPGELGEELRDLMGRVDGEDCLPLHGGLCAMLDDRGLCCVQLALGEAGLCESCRLHPRFAEEYGALQEWCLSLACPEAVRLLLEDPSPMTFSESVDETPVSGYNDLDPDVFFSLLESRKTAIGLVQDRSVPWQLRVSRLLAFAQRLQPELNAHRMGRMGEITALFAQGRFPQALPGAAFGDNGALLRGLAALEPINDRWPTMVQEALAADRSLEARRAFAAWDRPYDYLYEHLLVYGIYRYFLKAVNDRRLLPRVQAVGTMVLWVRALELPLWQAGGLSGEDRIDRIHRLSREVEHSQENWAALLERCETEPAFSPEALAAAARAELPCEE